MPPERLLGDPVATAIRRSVRERLQTLSTRGNPPTLATVLVTADPGANRFMDLKHAACADVGIETRDRRFGPETTASQVESHVESLGRDTAVDAVFVQTPVPDHVDVHALASLLVPAKDVDCFHPENRGRLVRGDPRFLPATPAAVCELFDYYDVDVAGKDVTIVGRSNVIGKPLANLLWRDESGANATVTVCHSHTQDLASKTRRADVVVTACGVPQLVDGEMLTPGVVVVDVSANRVTPDQAEDEATVVGDVEFESAREVASAITPVPGGVGPVTIATLLRNVVIAAERRHSGASVG